MANPSAAGEEGFPRASGALALRVSLPGPASTGSRHSLPASTPSPARPGCCGPGAVPAGGAAARALPGARTEPGPGGHSVSRWEGALAGEAGRLGSPSAPHAGEGRGAADGAGWGCRPSAGAPGLPGRDESLSPAAEQPKERCPRRRSPQRPRLPPPPSAEELAQPWACSHARTHSGHPLHKRQGVRAPPARAETQNETLQSVGKDGKGATLATRGGEEPAGGLGAVALPACLPAAGTLLDYAYS